MPRYARVTFTGETEAHTGIVGDLEYWKEAVRSTATSGFGDRAWVEKVIVHTRSKSKGVGKTVAGPLQELERLVAEIKTDDDGLLSLGEELSGLFRKLPAEYRKGDGVLDPGDPDLGHTCEELVYMIENVELVRYAMMTEYIKFKAQNKTLITEILAGREKKI